MNGDEFDEEEMALLNALSPLCGCTNDPSYEILRDSMRLMQEWHKTACSGHWSDTREPGWFEKLESRRSEATCGGSWEIVMLLIDVLDWSEHGGGVNGSWLTPKGEAALVAIERLLAIAAIRDAREEQAKGDGGGGQ